MAVAVVTDTTHYLPRELVDARALHEVSLYVRWPGEQARERDTDFGAFYDRLIGGDEVPTTSQPSVGDFLDVYRPLLERGDDIVSIHLSAGLSGTFESAQRARKQLAEEGAANGRITTVDSRTGAGALGLIVLAALAAARDGGDAVGVAARAETARAAIDARFCLDTFEYLRRGGRVGGTRAWIGTALQIKPILEIDSEVVPVERVRTAGRAFERLVEFAQERQADGADTWAVQHVRASEQASRLVERGRAIFGTEPEFVSEIGPVIGAHVGPGFFGIAAVRGEALR